VFATYQIEDGSWRCVTIPVYAYKPQELAGEAPWAFALAANPVPTPCAPRTGAPRIDPDEGSDLKPNGTVGNTLGSDFFPGFFAAWAASDSNALAQYAVPGFTTIGLGGAYSSVPPPTIANVELPTEDEGPFEGELYEARVTVTWTLAGSTSQVNADYIVPVTLTGDRWYVAGEPIPTTQSSDVGGASQATVPEPGGGITPGPSTASNVAA